MRLEIVAFPEAIFSSRRHRSSQSSSNRNHNHTQVRASRGPQELCRVGDARVRERSCVTPSTSSSHLDQCLLQYDQEREHGGGTAGAEDEEEEEGMEDEPPAYARGTFYRPLVSPLSTHSFIPRTRSHTPTTLAQSTRTAYDTHANVTNETLGFQDHRAEEQPLDLRLRRGKLFKSLKKRISDFTSAKTTNHERSTDDRHVLYRFGGTAYHRPTTQPSTTTPRRQSSIRLMTLGSRSAGTNRPMHRDVDEEEEEGGDDVLPSYESATASDSHRTSLVDRIIRRYQPIRDDGTLDWIELGKMVCVLLGAGLVVVGAVVVLVML